MSSDKPDPAASRAERGAVPPCDKGGFSACCQMCGKPPRLSLGPVNDVMNLNVEQTCECQAHAGQPAGFNVWWRRAERGDEDAYRLDYLLRKAMLCVTEDGERLGLFLCLNGNDDREQAVAVVAESSDEEEGTFLADDVPFLTEAQRTHLNEHGSTDDRAAILAALDKVRAARSASRPEEPQDD